jgi:DNA-binding transcriptional MerR regulator
MIRSYTINELEELSAVNRRTISDYVKQGLLAGPSHRGRGAVYCQRDLNVLQVIPRLRTLMKSNYGSLKSVAAFVAQLSIPEIHGLAACKTERAFVVEVRRLRVRNSLMSLIPHVAPEKIDAVLNQLTPEQICAVDAGRIQLGSVVDMGRLFAYERALTAEVPSGREPDDDTDRLPQLFTEADAEDSEIDQDAESDQADNEDTRHLLAMKLDEISSRLDRVEQMLVDEASTL